MGVCPWQPPYEDVVLSFIKVGGKNSHEIILNRAIFVFFCFMILLKVKTKKTAVTACS
jgi:hypothetical protein